MARGTLWAGAAAALGVVGLVWLAWPAAPMSGGARGDAVDAGAAAAPGLAPLTPSAGRAATAGARFIEVAVTACKRQAGAGVEVIVERGGRLYSARAGADGRARVDVEGAGEVTVRARIGAYRTEALAVDGARAAITACPGARVYGTVRDGSGVPEQQRIVRLLDAAGDVVDEIETDEDGAYAVADGMLDGASLVVVSDGSDEDATRSIRPLSPREDRELDLIVGDVRAVVGWVLDMHGEPQPGVVVTASAEAFGAGWTAFTDQGGGFAFEHVPAASLRVTADGGELGQAAARVAASEAERREVELVLEPTARITVIAPELAGTIEIRCWDGRFHGPDGLAEPAEEAQYATPYAFDHDEHGVEPPYEPAAEPELATADGEYAEPERLMSVLEDALRAYDERDPEGSIVHMIQSMMGEVPQMRESFVAEHGAVPEAPAAQEAFLRQLVADEMRKDPEQFAMFGRLAAEIKQGKSLMEASQAAYGGWEEPSAEDEDPEGLPPVELEASYSGEDEDAGAWVDGEVVSDEAEAVVLDGEGLTGEGETFVFEEPEGTPPGAWVTLPKRARAASGAIGEAISVRASFAYEVVLLTPEGQEVYVGRVFVHPGDDVVIPMSGDEPMTVTGRVVDVSGEPVSGVVVMTYGASATATTDADGAFRLNSTPSQAEAGVVTFSDPAGRYEPTSRRNVTIVGGGARDIGTVVVRAAAEEPPGQMHEPYGGIGGLVTLDELGVRLDDVEAESPLALYGVERGDTIVRVDDVAAAELPMNELLLRLRGEAGTTVNLRVRTAAGELYDVGILRDTIQPRSSWEPVWNDDIPQIEAD